MNSRDCCMPFHDNGESLNDSAGRNKYSAGHQTSENLMSDHAERNDDAPVFSEADTVKTGLVTRTPMSYRSGMNDMKGVNQKSRSKYDGS